MSGDCPEEEETWHPGHSHLAVSLRLGAGRHYSPFGGALRGHHVGVVAWDRHRGLLPGCDDPGRGLPAVRGRLGAPNELVAGGAMALVPTMIDVAHRIASN